MWKLLASLFKHLYQEKGGKAQKAPRMAKSDRSGSQTPVSNVVLLQAIIWLKLVPVVMIAPSVMAASVTCFAGITSLVFSSLPKEKQDFILTSSVNAALNDEVSSVRSAACHAFGVITCFPQIAQSAEILGKFIHAANINTRDPLVLVRIKASWALANICDSVHHCINVVTSKRCSVDLKVASHLIVLLIECSLPLTKDSDKKGKLRQRHFNYQETC